jgi:ubiquinone/menaquinone biosynthesis C-methylase UbiE
VTRRRTHDEAFAPHYTAAFAALQARKLRALVAHLPAPPPPPIVDAGCGTGMLARTTGWTVIHLDWARGMLTRASGPQRVQADLAALPFADASLGTVVCVSALVELDAPPPAVEELVRVVRPGGWLALSAVKRERVDLVEAALDRTPLSDVRPVDLESDVGWVGRRAR